ncbi:DUF4232 domain-containing protein [Frigoribacterium sp. 2-23]|uniref:DUF4232 domain-containing protein n=1 Tax=Frigoribacterium sp. 2-23 TaxID=3415006 RepID=UPI003C6FF323
MRLVRSFAPGAVAAVAWLLSGLINQRATGADSGTIGGLVSLLAPSTVWFVDLAAPFPWGAVSAALSALALGGAYSGLLALVRRRPSDVQRAGVGVAAYWFVAVAAGVAVASVPVVVFVVQSAQAGYLTGPGFGNLSQIAQWGVVWGWVPALVARALDVRAVDAPVSAAVGSAGVPADDDADDTRTATDDPVLLPFRRRLLVPLGAAVFLAAAVGGVVVSPIGDVARQAGYDDADAARQEPIPTVTPLPLVAPGYHDIDPLWCTSGQLTFSAGQAQAALGSRALVLTATNVSDASCVLDGCPDLAFSDILQNPLDVTVDHGGGMLADDAGPQAIDVPAGGTAQITLTWRAAGSGGVEPAGFAYVAAYAGAERQLVEVDTDISGGRVSTTAWALSGTPTG